MIYPKDFKPTLPLNIGERKIPNGRFKGKLVKEALAILRSGSIFPYMITIDSSDCPSPGEVRINSNRVFTAMFFPNFNVYEWYFKTSEDLDEFLEICKKRT